MSHRIRTRSAFTIVELLVVISIIAILIALLLPALGNAQRRGKKSNELNNLRQVGLAWFMYANANNDAALPGFLETDVQQQWKVSYRYPDNSKVPPAPNYSGPNYAGPWTWRLAQYLDYSHDILHGYSGEANPGTLEMIDHAEAIAYEPSFGYNGYYIGGYWEIFDDIGGGSESVSRPAPIFNWARRRGTGEPLRVVETSTSSIGRSAEIITFCAASRYDQGRFLHNFEDGRAGWHLVDPPYLADKRIWGESGPSSGHPWGDAPPGTPELFVDDGAPPYPRYTNTVAILMADGHVDNESLMALFDMRKWMDPPDTVDEKVFTFEEGIPSDHFASRP